MSGLLFLRRYGRYLLLMALVNVVVWYGFERVHSRELGYKELWPLRMYLWSGLLLLDTLAVLWWYADQTHRLAEMSEGQLQFQASQWRVANKPIVFIDADISIDPDGRRAI